MNTISHAIALLRRVNRYTLLGCEWLTVALVAAITVIVCAGVFWRYVLNDSLVWSEETAKFLMVWMVFAASPIALAHGSHAAIDALPAALPARARDALFALIHLLILGFVYVLITQGYGFAVNARVQTTPTTGISMMVVFSAMPVGGVLLGMIALQQMLECVLGALDGSRPAPVRGGPRTAGD
jgi:TRAP-type C4-dicarboxylate transport system permease small subunit